MSFTTPSDSNHCAYAKCSAAEGRPLLQPSPKNINDQSNHTRCYPHFYYRDDVTSSRKLNNSLSTLFACPWINIWTIFFYQAHSSLSEDHEYVDSSTVFATPEIWEIYGRFVNAAYTVSLLRPREHQVYVQDAEEMVSDAFMQGICSLNKKKPGSLATLL